MIFSTALLAGGRSVRMGKEKALLVVNMRGQLLIERQLELLAALHPYEQLVSCRYDQELPVPSDVRKVLDYGAHGPIGGVTAVLRSAQSPFVLILGLDHGKMNLATLRHIVVEARKDTATGVVARTSDGIQPTVALLPRELAAMAKARIDAGGDLSLQGLMRAGVEADLLRWYDVKPADEKRFANWNRPSDVAPAKEDEEESAGPAG